MRSYDWNVKLNEIARAEPDTTLRRVLLALVSKKAEAQAKRIVIRALKNIDSLKVQERTFCSLISDYNISIEETLALDALQRDTLRVLKLLDDFLFSGNRDKHPIKVERIGEWIEVLHSKFPPEDWTSQHSLGSACAYLARMVPIVDQRTILSIANSSDNQRRDFALGMIVPHIPAITTDLLNEIASKRLVEMYVTGKIEPHPSPGDIATEKFISETVLPYAESIGEDAWERRSIEQVLLDAGRRHDRRYHAPWSPTARTNNAR
ncbi:hypothetical protein [Bradyrhizobium sp. LA6.1]|uniref:hypothetical protein n=1 Tax=Bradyrhizobium sp. LA6.1 TaxID=3156378 RepID=UPI003398C813